MFPTDIFGCLSKIPLLSNAESRSISAENPTGEKGGGARETPGPDNPGSEMGKGWKIRPCITLGKGTTVTLADIKGPGVIQHIWLTVKDTAYRNCMLRFFWDDEKTPSVEVPVGDFFCNGHGLRCKVNSLPIVVNPTGGFNCYFPMPFRSRAVITIENQHWEDIGGFYYQVNYALTEIPENAASFHAQWRRSMTSRNHSEHVILDGVKGRGHYVGTYLAWTQLSDGWWGEGEVKFFIDGDEEHPTICGTGTEDYFGGAWCFGETYSTPFLGYPLWQKEPGQVPKHGMYRWHIPDPIRFARDLRVTVQALGWWPNRKYQPLTDDIASTAYWYQTEPHAPFPDMPPVQERWPR
jgi:hypothetical protein